MAQKTKSMYRTRSIAVKPHDLMNMNLNSLRVRLTTWSPTDRWVLERTLGDADSTRYLGGPESPSQIAARHERYLKLAPPDGQMFTVRNSNTDEVLGKVGFWEKSWNGERIYEAGWSILAEHSGYGIATQAALLVARYASNCKRNRFLHAFPSIENLASNRVCERAGFTNLGECEFEYPKGSTMRSHNWRLDLFALTPEIASDARPGMA